MLCCEGEDMKERIKEVIERKYGTVRRTRHMIKLVKLEKAVIESFKYGTDYIEAGDRSAFQAGIEALVTDRYLTPIIKKAKFKSTYLEEAYWLAVTASSLEGWSETAMMRVIGAKELNLDYYRNHPEAQTTEVWKYIERIYHFLRTAEDRETITREERSLELFDQEKFLSEPEGKQFLSRLGLNLEMLKADIVHEDFEYHRRPNRPARCILISENHSFYNSAKRLMKSGQTVCGLQPDMLIYGEGWKIVSSLYFLEERGVEPLEAELYYIGDMDKTGWDIYGNLKLSYPELNIKLALPVYSYMFSKARQSYDYVKEQNDCSPLHLEIARQEVSAVPGLLLCMDTLLKENKRIPQEVLNYEVMARLAGA
jgi:hypothetical protein